MVRGEAVEVLDEDLLHNGRVRDGKPRGRHVVEAVYSTILFSPLHVQLGVGDLFGENLCCFLDTQVSLAPTHVSWLVRKSVSP